MLTFCSSLHYIIYYSFFNITIINYLTITEYAPLFLEHILSYGLIILGGAAYQIISDWGGKNDKWGVVFGISLGTIHSLIKIFFFSEYTYKIVFEITFIIYYLIFLIFYLRKIKKRKSNLLFYLTFTSIVFSISSGIERGYKVVEKKSSLTYEFELSNLKLMTSENCIYLGKSQNFLFFYDIERKASEIHRTDDLRNITIIEKE